MLGLSLIISLPVLIASILIYFIGAFFTTEFIHWFGKKFIKLGEWYPGFLYLPKLKHWFELQNNNELRLYIQNPRLSKKVDVEYSFRKCGDIRKRDFIKKYRTEIKQIESQLGVTSLLFSGTLVSNDKREIKIGIPDHGKLALYLGNALLSNFPDETFEYIVSCEGTYLNRKFVLNDFSVWLTIKNGVLVEIKDKL
jgi:hypothetical protein